MEEVYAPWAKLQEAEAMAHGDAQVRVFLDGIVELQMAVIRLFYAVLEDDLRINQSARSVELARALIVRLPDEKAPEDLHQRIRNYQKTRRYRKVTRSAIFGQMQTSGVLEDRGLKAVKPNAHAVVKAMHYRPAPKAAASSQVPEWPKDFDRVLKPNKTWPTASVPVFFNSTLNLGIVETWSEERDPRDLWNSWWSRLLVPMQCYRHLKLEGQPCFVPMAIGQFAAMVVYVRPSDSETNALTFDTSKDAVTQMMICSDVDIESIHFKPEFSKAGALVLLEDRPQRESQY
jgi:hypothetical protein